MLINSYIIYHTTSFSPHTCHSLLVFYSSITYIAKTPALRGITQDVQEEFDSFVDVMEKRKDEKDLLAAYADVLDYYMYPEDSEDFSSEDFDSEDYDFEERGKKGKKGGKGYGKGYGRHHTPYYGGHGGGDYGRGVGAHCGTGSRKECERHSNCRWHRTPNPGGYGPGGYCSRRHW